MEDLRSIFPPSMITPEGNIIVSDLEDDEWLKGVSPERLEAAKKRLKEFSREYRLLHPDDATPPSDKQDPEKPA